MGRLKDETISGAKWQMLQKATLQPVQLIYGMVLARLLTPAETGILGLTAIFFAVAGQLASSGFGAALIRKQDRTETDINTMFWFNVGMSFLLAALLFLAAPWFADFYRQPALVNITRVSAGMLFLNSLAGVHWVLYSCRRDFKTPAIIHTIVAILGMPLCLTLAYMGWSYWALVAQGVFTGLLHLIIVWIVSPWKPRFLFSFKSFRELFGFGSKLAASGLLYVLYMNLRTFIIGKFYTPADLGLYTRGSHIATLIPHTVSGVLDSVSYPILSTVQDNDERLLSAYRKYICISTLVISWGVLLMCSLGKPLVALMYGENWLFCVPYLQIVALSCCVNHVCTINLNLLKVKGRSDLFLRLEIIKRAISVALVIFAATISIEAICWAGVFYTQAAIFINSYYTGKLIKLTWWQQQKDYLPYVMFAAASTIPAWCSNLLPISVWFPHVSGDWQANCLHYGALMIQVGVFSLLSVIIYFGGLKWYRDTALKELMICITQHPKFSKIPLLGSWARSVVNP